MAQRPLQPSTIFRRLKALGKAQDWAGLDVLLARIHVDWTAPDPATEKETESTPGDLVHMAVAMSDPALLARLLIRGAPVGGRGRKSRALGMALDWERRSDLSPALQADAAAQRTRLALLLIDAGHRVHPTHLLQAVKAALPEVVIRLLDHLPVGKVQGLLQGKPLIRHALDACIIQNLAMLRSAGFNRILSRLGASALGGMSAIPDVPVIGPHWWETLDAIVGHPSFAHPDELDGPRIGASIRMLPGSGAQDALYSAFQGLALLAGGDEEAPEETLCRQLDIWATRWRMEHALPVSPASGSPSAAKPGRRL